MKHGTCGTIISELNTQQKYFALALAWRQQYPMNKLLSKANITPGGEYNVVDFQNAVKNVLSVNPAIHCTTVMNGEEYVTGIGICFDHQLKLIHCHDVSGNCNTNKPIQYPSEVPKSFLERTQHNIV